MYNFERNFRGGWVVPDNSVIESHTVIPDYSEFGNGCKLGYECTLGNRCTLGDWCTMGDSCTLGNGCKLGDECKLGNGCKLGDECKLDEGCMLGDGCTWLGVGVLEWLTLGNVDGMGRQIKIVKHDAGVMIEAGCFMGTADEFIDKARAEGKMKYVSIVSAVVGVM